LRLNIDKFEDIDCTWNFMPLYFKENNCARSKINLLHGKKGAFLEPGISSQLYKTYEENTLDLPSFSISKLVQELEKYLYRLSNIGVALRDGNKVSANS
jgi:hypothetical protein